MHFSKLKKKAYPYNTNSINKKNIYLFFIDHVLHYWINKLNNSREIWDTGLFFRGNLFELTLAYVHDRTQ